MLTKLTPLALLALTHLTTAQPCLSSDFSLALSYPVNNGKSLIWLSLNALHTSSKGTLVLVAERLVQYPGVPVSLSGKSGNATLTLQPQDKCSGIPKGDYGLSVPDLGELYGHSEPAIATLDKPWPHFFYGQDGSVSPQLTAASQLWMACNATYNGQDYITLSLGIYNNNGSAPYGCVPTSVKMVYNIPCFDNS